MLIPDPDDPNIIDISLAKNAKFLQRKLLENQAGIKPVPIMERVSRNKKPGSNKKQAKPKKGKDIPAKVKEEPKDPVSGEGMKKLQALDDAKVRKALADADLKELEYKQKKGDLVSATSIAPMIRGLSVKRDKYLQVETKSIIQDLVVEFELPPDFIGRFEREFVEAMNNSNKKAVEEYDFKTEVNG